MGLGIKSGQIKELDWWGKVEFPKLKIQAMPSQHRSARSLFARNETLWASWFIHISNKKIGLLVVQVIIPFNFGKLVKKLTGWIWH